MKEHFIASQTESKKKVLNDSSMQRHKRAGMIITFVGLMLLLLGLVIAWGKGNPVVTIISLLPIIVGFVIWNNARQ